jgi:hypothetical protein
LRGGVRFFPYLDRGNYLGADASKDLIDAGITRELADLFDTNARYTVLPDLSLHDYLGGRAQHGAFPNVTTVYDKVNNTADAYSRGFDFANEPNA